MTVRREQKRRGAFSLGIILRRHGLEALCTLAALLAGVALFGGALPLAEFTSEVVRLQMDPRHLHVDARFTYTNPWPFPITQGFTCPTPAGAGLGAPTGLVVESRTHGHANLVPLRNLAGLPHGEVRIPARSTAEVRLRYIQTYAHGRGVYLLTTTAPWKRPLAHGRYELTLRGLRLLRSNYPAQRIRDGHYAFDRVQFMPLQDWVVDVDTPGGTSCLAAR